MNQLITANPNCLETKNFKKVATLSKGLYFGELALITNKLRAATIRCETDCHLATIDAKTFQLIK